MQEKQSLSQEQKLQQRLSPMQVQYVKMLEMNRLEVEEAVRNEIEDNPALEIAEPSPLEEAVTKDDEGQEFTESADDMQRADYRDEDDIPYYRTNINNSSPDDEHNEAIAISETSLIDYLEEQLGERDLDEHSLLIAKYIIGNIDDNGYLLRSAIAISDDIAFQTGLDVSSAQVNDVLQIVRDLDPPGVGATPPAWVQSTCATACCCSSNAAKALRPTYWLIKSSTGTSTHSSNVTTTRLPRLWAYRRNR